MKAILTTAQNTPAGKKIAKQLSDLSPARQKALEKLASWVIPWFDNIHIGTDDDGSAVIHAGDCDWFGPTLADACDALIADLEQMRRNQKSLQDTLWAATKHAIRQCEREKE